MRGGRRSGAVKAGLRLAAASMAVSLLSCTTILRSREGLGIPEKTIILAFDDGPSEREELDMELLDVLGKRETRVFFCLIGSKLKGHEAVVRRILEDGHRIAFHSQNHEEYMSKNPETFFEEYKRFNEEISAIVGRPFVAGYVRPPAGIVNIRLEKAIEERGIVLVRSTHYPSDTFVNSFQADDYMARIEAEILRKRGGLFTFHDGIELFPRPRPGDFFDPKSSADREWLPGRVGRLIEDLKAAGFIFSLYP